jgi:ribosomal protein L29
MSKLKFSDVKKMNAEEKIKKLKELKLELTKSLGKAGGKTKEIKKMIARILTAK